MLAEKLQKRGGGREWLLNQMEAEKAGGPAPQSAGGANHVQSASGVGQAHVRINVPPAVVNPKVQGAPPPPPSNVDMDDKAVERAMRVKRAMADLKLDDMLEMEKMDQQVGALGDLMKHGKRTLLNAHFPPPADSTPAVLEKKEENKEEEKIPDYLLNTMKDEPPYGTPPDPVR